MIQHRAKEELVGGRKRSKCTSQDKERERERDSMSHGEKQLLGRRNERERNGTGGGDGGREKARGVGWKKRVGEEMDGES